MPESDSYGIDGWSFEEWFREERPSYADDNDGVHITAQRQYIPRFEMLLKKINSYIQGENIYIDKTGEGKDAKYTVIMVGKENHTFTINSFEELKNLHNVLSQLVEMEGKKLNPGHESGKLPNRFAEIDVV